MWTSFRVKKPQEKDFVITRTHGYDGGDAFEDWQEWTKEILNCSPPPSHWWDGPPDFDLATSKWISKWDK